MNIAPLGREATLEDLLDFEGPAELIDGEIVPDDRDRILALETPPVSSGRA